MTTITPVDIIAKLHYINQNNQDAFFNLLAFSLQALSIIIKAGSNVNNVYSTGLSNLGQSINSSRFILRFLSGISSIHILLKHRTFIIDFFKSLIHKKSPSNPNTPNPSPDQSSTSEGFDDEKKPSEQQSTLGRIQKIIQMLRLVQSLLTLANNVFEMPAYVSTVAPMLYNYKGDWFGRVSCLFWLLNTIVEIVIVSLMKYNKEIASAQYQVALIPLICDVFLSANWSLQSKNQFLSESGLTALGLVSAMVNFRSIWSNINPDQQ